MERMTPIPKSLLISLLAVCLLVPGVVEAHHANPWVAGLITPVCFAASYLGWSLAEPEGVDPEFLTLFTTVPVFGQLYAGDFKGALMSVLLWGIGISSFVIADQVFGGSVAVGVTMLVTIPLTATAYLVDILHAPIAAKRHNEKHERERVGSLDSRLRGNAAKEKESSRLTIFPTLALGKESMRAGIGILF